MLWKLLRRKQMVEVKEPEPKKPDQKYFGIANEDIPLFEPFQEWLKNELELDLLEFPLFMGCMILGPPGQQQVHPPWEGNPYSELYGATVIKYIDTHPHTAQLKKSVLYCVYYRHSPPTRKGDWEDFIEGMYKIIRRLDGEFFLVEEKNEVVLLSSYRW